MKLLVLKGQHFDLGNPHGFHTEVCHDLDDLRSMLNWYEYEAVVVGFEHVSLLRQVRRATKLPITVMCMSYDAQTRIQALEEGADYCLPVPFNLDELRAAVLSTVRRAHGITRRSVFSGELRVDLSYGSLFYGEREICLTPTEWLLLECLALRVDRVVPKDTILNHIYGDRVVAEQKIVDVYACKVRKKIKLHSGLVHIETVWGRGWKFTTNPFANDRQDTKGSDIYHRS